MTQKEARRLTHGWYRLWWKDGGYSMAVVGSLHDGKRWYACANWTSKSTRGVASVKWNLVEVAAKIGSVKP